MDLPETLCARNDDLRSAYQVIGEGPHDLVYTGSLTNQIEHAWERPVESRFLERLASPTKKEGR